MGLVVRAHGSPQWITGWCRDPAWVRTLAREAPRTLNRWRDITAGPTPDLDGREPLRAHAHPLSPRLVESTSDSARCTRPQTPREPASPPATSLVLLRRSALRDWPQNWCPRLGDFALRFRGSVWNCPFEACKEDQRQLTVVCDPLCQPKQHCANSLLIRNPWSRAGLSESWDSNRPKTSRVVTRKKKQRSCATEVSGTGVRHGNAWDR